MGLAKDNPYTRWFENLSSGNVAIVGGKNSSPGEMIQTLKGKRISVPDGFATTIDTPPEEHQRFVSKGS